MVQPKTEPKPTKRAGEAAPKKPAKGTNGADRKSSVYSLGKGLRVLEAFPDGDSLTLSQIAAATGLDVGTAYRLVNTFVENGYLARVPDSRRFRLSLKVLDLGFHAIAHSDLRSLVRPSLQSLTNGINEAASFAVLEGGDVLYIERVRAGTTRLGVDIRIGTTIPATVTLIGRTILAFMSDAEVEKTIAIPPRHPTAVPPPSREALAKILKRIRRDGYTVGEALTSQALRLLAVPVLHKDGAAIGAISITAPAVYSTDEDLLTRALPLMKDVASHIAQAHEATGMTGHILADIGSSTP